MFALYKLAAFPLPRHPCQYKHSVIVCSSTAMGASPESWPAPAPQPDSSRLDRAHPATRSRKRQLIAGVDQADRVDPWLLADPDSRFAELHGVHIHYKIATASADVGRDHLASRDEAITTDDRSSTYASSSLPSASLSPESSEVSSPSPASSECTSPHSQSSSSSSSSSSPELVPPLPSRTIPAILLHGFGASLFSWERVLKRLADILRSHVVAYDRPAFGLTSRIDVPLAKNAAGNGGLVPVAPNPYTIAFSSAATVAFIDFLQASKAVLIGHSAGCIIAADAYLKAPERIAAMVFVAPALFAPLAVRKKRQLHQNSKMQNSVLAKFWFNFMSVIKKIGDFIQFIISSIQSLWYRLLAALLRSEIGYWLIRIVMDKLSLRAVRMAWYDQKKVDDYVISGYTKPLKCRQWERALLEYVIALVGDPSLEKRQRPISQRLEEIHCPVLVITGDSDALVPAWNAERLSRILPNAQYHVIKNCGHLPQEETPEEFVRIIGQFMQHVQQGSIKETGVNETAVFMPA